MGPPEAAEAAARARSALPERVLDRLRRGLPGRGEAGRALEDELERLEAAVLRLEEGTGLSGEDLRAAIDLGCETRSLLWLAGALSDEPASDPLDRVEEEIGRVERSARALARSRSGLHEEARAIMDRAARARIEVARGKASRLLLRLQVLRSGVPIAPGDAEKDCWLDAREASLVEAEIRARAAAASEPPPLEETTSLRKLREAAIESCAVALRSAGPDRASRFFRDAAADLADGASVVLSETAGAHPAQRLPALESLRDRVGALSSVMEASGCLRPGALPAPERRETARKLRSLLRARRRAIAAGREAEARLRLEAFFGPRAVRAFETFLLFALGLFLCLVAIELKLPEDSPWIPAVHAADIALCALFQIDFFVRWAFARWSGDWFLRHFFLESLPALPYGFLLAQLPRAGAVEGVRAVIVARLLRLRPVLLLLVRGMRILAFFVQGSDRVVDRFRRHVDRDFLLFESVPVTDLPEHPARARLLRLEARRERAAHARLDETPVAARAPLLVERLRLLEEEARAYAGIPSPAPSRVASAPGEVHIERLIERLLEWDAARVTELLGPEGAIRARRWLRYIDLPILRRAPFLSRLAPAARIEDPPEAVAAAGRAVGEMLENFVGAMRFWGDLSGITTGPQILDRIATGMIAAARTPAFRLILFGGTLLLLEGLVELLRIRALENPLAVLRNVVGLPLLVIGGVCLVFFQVGRWFKRIAGEALDIYLRTADAGFYPLLKGWKRMRLRPDGRQIHRSVFLPETALPDAAAPAEDDFLERLEAFVIGIRKGDPDLPGDRAAAGSSCDAVAMLYADFLDGPILSRDDDRTANQILGNLVIQDIRTKVLRMTRKEMRKLERLNLEKDRVLTLGPYFWFRFITESLAIETSKLVMEYKTSCIPRDELHLAGPGARKRLETFLEARKDAWNASVERMQSRALRSLGEPVLTDEFHALDFLAMEPRREEALRKLFGDDVVKALARDRRGMVRDIFGTHPYHLLPRERRVVNPYRLYRRYLGGARFLLLPLFAVVAALRLTVRSILGALALVREVLGTGGSREARPAREASFDVAVRKINRMRKPFFMEALRVRAAVDLQYLGLRSPGSERETDGPSYREDLEFIGARRSERAPVEALRAEAVKNLRRFRALARSRGWLGAGPGEGLDGLVRKLDPSGRLEERRGEVSRAIVTAFLTDEGNFRSELLALDQARDFLDDALAAREGFPARLLGDLRRAWPASRRTRALLGDYLARVPESGDLTPADRRKVERAIDRAAGARAVFERAVAKLSGAPADGDLALVRLQAERHPLWTRRILTARAIQVLTVLDMKSYRDLVHKAGGYQ